MFKDLLKWCKNKIKRLYGFVIFSSNFLYINDSFENFDFDFYIQTKKCIENFNFKLLMTFNDFIELSMKKNLFES